MQNKTENKRPRGRPKKAIDSFEEDIKKYQKINKIEDSSNDSKEKQITKEEFETGLLKNKDEMRKLHEKDMGYMWKIIHKNDVKVNVVIALGIIFLIVIGHLFYSMNMNLQNELKTKADRVCHNETENTHIQFDSSRIVPSMYEEIKGIGGIKDDRTYISFRRYDLKQQTIISINQTNFLLIKNLSGDQNKYLDIGSGNVSRRDTFFLGDGELYSQEYSGVFYPTKNKMTAVRIVCPSDGVCELLKQKEVCEVK